MELTGRRLFTVTVVPTGVDLAPGDLLFEGSGGPFEDPVGFGIRLGTWSRYNHVGVVLEDTPDGLVVVEGLGDLRGTAVRISPQRHTLAVALRLDVGRPDTGKAVATHAAQMAGQSGHAWLDGNLPAALTTPGTPYGWLSILRISVRSATRVPVLRYAARPALAALRTVADTGALICSEHVRAAVEAATGVVLSDVLPTYETSPQDLLSLMLDDGYTPAR